MSSRAAAQRAVVALALFHLVACRGQLRLEDDGGNVNEDAGTDSPRSHDDGGQPHVGCVKDADCGLSTLHCDALSGSCVACVSDDQCVAPAGRRCDGALHRCVECGVDGDCGMGRVCVQATRRCATTCAQLTDCVSTGFFCEVMRGICVRCTGDSVCKNLDPDQPYCEVDGLCAQCLDDSACPSAKPRCDRTRGTCVECLGTADCSGTKRFCDPVASACAGP